METDYQNTKSQESPCDLVISFRSPITDRWPPKSGSPVRFSRYDSGMVIMGVDPGSRVTGYGIVSVDGNHLHCLDYGAISVVLNGSAPEIPERLRKIHSALTDVMVRFEPEIVVVEGLFYAVNVKSALTLGHARGVVLLAAAQRGLPVSEYSPLEVKKAVTGYGRADKKQVQTMVKTLLNLKSEPQPHDASDALALALCQAFSGKGLKHRQGRWRNYAPKGGG